MLCVCVCVFSEDWIGLGFMFSEVFGLDWSCELISSLAVMCAGERCVGWSKARLSNFRCRFVESRTFAAGMRARKMCFSLARAATKNSDL